jgi:hypothetical protein
VLTGAHLFLPGWSLLRDILLSLRQSIWSARPPPERLVTPPLLLQGLCDQLGFFGSSLLGYLSSWAWAFFTLVFTSVPQK